MALPEPRNDSAALITGASAGFGEGFARALAGRRHNLILVARRRDRLEALARELGAEGVRAEVLDADLSERGVGERLAERIGELGLTVDLLINNAGFGSHGGFPAGGLERELEQVRVNVEAVVDLTGRFLPGMVERGRGAIVNVASIAAFQPLPYEAIYGASKAFVLSFSEAVHAEVAGTGVTVTAVCPGPVPTEWQAVAGFENQAERLPYPRMTVEQIVEESLAAAAAGKRAVIPGRLTRAMALATRALPTSMKLPVASRSLRP